MAYWLTRGEEKDRNKDEGIFFAETSGTSEVLKEVLAELKMQVMLVGNS